MTTRLLNAFANGERVGTVIEENDIWSFTYDGDWLASPTAFPLSPIFPLQTERFVDGSSKRPVQWFFDNLLPEESMRTMLAREAGVNESDAWGLLAHYGQESAGALTLLKDDAVGPAGALKPLSFEGLEARIRGMPQRPLAAAAPKRMSVAGAQPKLLVTMKGKPPECELFEPMGDQPSMQLLKPDSPATTGYPHAAINEFFCMQLARAMELLVPDTYLVRVPTACYIIDRFDRDLSSTPPRRRHIIDATQLLNYARTFKYEQVNAEKLREAIDITNTKVSSRLSVFRWSVFNVLIGNADAHLKNLSFFVTHQGYALAPFYDLVSTVVYNTKTYQNECEGTCLDCPLSMPVGKATHYADIGRSDMLQFAEALGLPASGAGRILDKMLAVIGKRTEETLKGVHNLAKPNAGETRLLASIDKMPIAEMSRALKK